MVVDVHSHVIPVAFGEFMRRRHEDLGFEVVDGPRGTQVVYGGTRRTAPLRADLGDIDQRLGEMDRMGIDVQVLAGWIDLTGYELDETSAVEYSRAHNEAIAEVEQAHPDRFWSIGTVPLQAPAAAAAELSRVLDAGMKGIEIATSVRGKRLDQAELDPVWELASARGAFILLHPMTPLTGVDLGDFFMENLVGRPAETTITIAGLILSGVLDRFPDLKLCAVHGGGFAPFQIGRLDRGAREKPEVVAGAISRLPSEYLSSLYFDTVLHDPRAVRYLMDIVGSGQVVVGTDYPFEMGDDDPVDLIQSVPGITQTEIEAISGGTAARLLA